MRLVWLAIVVLGCGTSAPSTPTSGTPGTSTATPVAPSPAPRPAPTPATPAPVPTSRDTTTAMPLASVLTELLDLASAGPPTAAQLEAALAPRATTRETGNNDLTYPAWARGTQGAGDVFLTMSGPIAGIALWEDSRGWGAYAEISVTAGTLADVEGVVGPTKPVPRNPGDFKSGDKVAAYVQRGGKTVRVFAELTRDKTAVQRVTIHFQK